MSEVRSRIWELIEQGKTRKEVREAVGLSRQRVFVIIQQGKDWAPSKPGRPPKKSK